MPTAGRKRETVVRSLDQTSTAQRSVMVSSAHCAYNKSCRKVTQPFQATQGAVQTHYCKAHLKKPASGAGHLKVWSRLVTASETAHGRIQQHQGRGNEQAPRCYGEARPLHKLLNGVSCVQAVHKLRAPAKQRTECPFRSLPELFFNAHEPS